MPEEHLRRFDRAQTPFRLVFLVASRDLWGRGRLSVWPGANEGVLWIKFYVC
jgi:hypothetical protein